MQERLYPVREFETTRKHFFPTQKLHLTYCTKPFVQQRNFASRRPLLLPHSTPLKPTTQDPHLRASNPALHSPSHDLHAPAPNPRHPNSHNPHPLCPMAINLLCTHSPRPTPLATRPRRCPRSRERRAQYKALVQLPADRGSSCADPCCPVEDGD